MLPSSIRYLKREEFKKSLEKSKLYVIPLGGCGAFGMNMTCYLKDNKMILVDAGSLFAEPWMLGFSSIIPDPNFWLFDDFELLGYFITHAHEDHIGALPHMLKSREAPVFASPWTIEVLKRKFQNHFVNADLKKVEAYEEATTGPFSVKFFPIGHSIPDAMSFLIRSEGKSCFHTGDFKFDNPDGSIPESLSTLSQTPIDLLLCDSTNAEKDGFCPEENSVCDPLEQQIRQSTGNVYIASFSSNFMRLKWIAEICKKLRKPLFLSGTGIKANVEVGKQLGLVEEGAFLDENKASSAQKNSVIFLSGCQGEFRSSLARIANQEHRFFQIRENDRVIFSSRPIPGNEKNISDIKDRLKQLKAKVITSREDENIHVSGHAFGGEIETLLHFLKPEVFVPVHGTYTQQVANAERYKGKNLIVKNGSILELSSNETRILDHIKVPTVYIDDQYGLLFEKSKFVEKMKFHKKGTAQISGVISMQKKKWSHGPQIRMTGLVAEEAWVRDCEQKLSAYVMKELSKTTTAKTLKSNLRCYWDTLLSKSFRSRPISYIDVWMLE